MSVDKRKYHDEMTGRGQFALVPNELLRSQVDQQAKWLWVYVLMQAPGWESSRNNLARNLGRSKDSISESIKTLVSNGMLAIHQAPNGAWDMEVLPPSRWQKVQSVDLQSVDLQSVDLQESGPLEVRTSPRSTLQEEKREEKKEEKPTIEAIYGRWLASISEVPKFTECPEELGILMGSLASYRYGPEDLTPSFKKKVLGRWKRSKYPERHEEAWDRAVGTSLSDGVKLSEASEAPEIKLKTKRADSQISVDTALGLLTEDTDVLDIVAEFNRLREDKNG